MKSSILPTAQHEMEHTFATLVHFLKSRHKESALHSLLGSHINKESLLKLEF